MFKFVIIQDSGPYEVMEPFTVFRFVNHIDEEITGGQIYQTTTVDELIEQPDVGALFAVLGEIGRNEWVVYYADIEEIPGHLRGKFFISKWVNRPQTYRGMRGASILDSGYFYAPYVPTMRMSTPIALDPDFFRKTKGIITRYGKKLLAQGAKYYETAKNK